MSRLSAKIFVDIAWLVAACFAAAGALAQPRAIMPNAAPPTTQTAAKPVAPVPPPKQIDQRVTAAHTDILLTYNFDANGLSVDEQGARSAKMGGLWERYAKNPTVYSEALRAELATPGQKEILYCDGGMLLIQNAVNPAETAIGVNALKECTLAEIEQTPYFYTMHALALRGTDTTPLQLRMLARPRYEVFLTQHATRIGQDYAFTYPFLVRDEAVYVPKLIERLRTETDPIAQESLLVALSYAATNEAETMIRAVAQPGSGAGAPLRERAGKMVQQIDAARAMPFNDQRLARAFVTLKLPTTAPEGMLRAKRKQRMRVLNDEAVLELDIYTTLIYRSRKQGA